MQCQRKLRPTNSIPSSFCGTVGVSGHPVLCPAGQGTLVAWENVIVVYAGNEMGPSYGSLARNVQNRENESAGVPLSADCLLRSWWRKRVKGSYTGQSWGFTQWSQGLGWQCWFNLTMAFSDWEMKVQWWKSWKNISKCLLQAEAQRRKKTPGKWTFREEVFLEKKNKTNKKKNTNSLKCGNKWHQFSFSRRNKTKLRHWCGQVIIQLHYRCYLNCLSQTR